MKARFKLCVLSALLVAFSVQAFAADEMSVEELFSKVKKNTDKIKNMQALITRKELPSGDIMFTGKFFYKPPMSRIDFTGPDEFEGAGLSAISGPDGIVTVDKDGYALGSAAQSGMGGVFSHIAGDMTDFGDASVTVAPAEDYNKDGKIRYYEVSIRQREASAEELAPIEHQKQFMRELARSGQMPPDAYKQWEAYSRKRSPSVGASSDCAFCDRDRDIIVDYERGLISEIYVLSDGDVLESVKYHYVMAGGIYVPSRVEFSDGEDEFEITLSAIRASSPIPDRIFRYKDSSN